jgi:hypothetical protein
MADDWDTGSGAEGQADKFNKFARGASGKAMGDAAVPAAQMAALTVEAPVEAPSSSPGASSPMGRQASGSLGSVGRQASGSVSSVGSGAGVASPAAPVLAPAVVKSVPAAQASPAVGSKFGGAASPGAAAGSPASPASPGIGMQRRPSDSMGGAAGGAARKASTTVPKDAPEFLKTAAEGAAAGKAFTEKLSAEALAFFNELCMKPFSEQAVAFLNAYWAEVGGQAEFIFAVGWEMIKYADMHSKGVQYVHLYKEGNDLDFNIGLYFYEKLCKKVLDDDEGKKWRDDAKWKPSLPEMMTAIKRKIELREKVDCNFDGRVSFLEYLLYQYQGFANPADFTFRAMKTANLEEHPEIVKARKALEEVNKAIQAYEAEKHRLTEESQKPGVKGLGAKHQLAILDASPLAETLNKALITAEAAVRIACRKFGTGLVPAAPGATGTAQAGEHRKPTEGSLWWLQRELEEKKKLYGPRKTAAAH